jgi:type III secretion system YscD/HrpQ family protein
VSETSSGEPIKRADADGLELRLIAGLHAGASVSLAPGQSVSIGRSRTCDVVLHDAPFDEARLEAFGETWIWLEPDGTRQQLRAGGGLRAGSLVLTVDRAEAAWVGVNQISVAWNRSPEAALESSLEADASSVAPESTPAAPEATIEQTLTQVPSPELPATKRGTLASRGWVLAPAVVVAGLAWVATSVWLEPSRHDAESAGSAVSQDVAPAQANSTASADDLARVQQRISEAGFNDVVRAGLRADGRIEIVGVLASADEQDELIRVLSPERRLLALNLLTQSELSERLREVRRMLPEGFDARAMAGGRVALSGLNLDHADSALAQSVVERQVPQAVAIVNTLTGPGELAASLAEEARGKGFPSVTVAWTDSRLVVNGSIPRDRTSDWEQFLRALHGRFGERVPARVAISVADPVPLPSAVAVPQSPLPLPKLPRIVAVQSGAASYLLFADGLRILPGGVINGYRLTAIGDEELIFEDARGNEYRVPR